MAGDFNVTPWAPLYRTLIKSGWTDARALHPIQNTWPALLGATFWGIPIDHTLTRGAARVTTRRVGPSLGSDHLPVTNRIEFLTPRTDLARGRTGARAGTT